MLPHVRLRLPDHSLETLVPGDLIGRTWSAALRLDDPEVSEAHALISLRGAQLWLLALRRRFWVGGKALDAWPIAAGATVRLAPRLALMVEAVTLPDVVLGLEGPGLPAQPLPGTCSLLLDPQPRLVPGVEPGAAAVLWATGERWRARIGELDLDLAPGLALSGPAAGFCAVSVAISAAGQEPTRLEAEGPLRIVTSFDTVQLHPAGRPVVLLAGQLARVVSELAAVQQPLPWEELARPLWPHIDERDTLRRRWDGLLNRLRERLRAEGLRPDLVVSSHVGLVELILRAGDEVVDRC
jgi:hypothetical protein